MSDNLTDRQIAEQTKKQFMEGGGGEKLDVPSEIITLPSAGYFYSSDNPLSSGQIKLKYPTAREEDILTSKNLIAKNIVIDEFLKSLILSPVNYDELLLGDVNGIMVASRILAYGTDYHIMVECPQCGFKDKEIHIDLSNIESKDVNFDNYTKGQNSFELTLPASKKKVKFKLLNHADSKKIDEEIAALKKKSLNSDKQMTTRLKYAITDIDGKTDRGYISTEVDKMLSRDAYALRQAIQKVTPDINLDFDFKCRSCDYEEEGRTIPLGIEFFWPSGKI